jgi:hypothetical protein
MSSIEIKEKQKIPAYLSFILKTENYQPGGNDETREYNGKVVNGQCFHCEKPPNYVVSIYSEKEYLNDEEKYIREKVGLQFLCRKHFDIFYRHIVIMPQDVFSWMRNWTFKDMKTYLKQKN